MRINPERIIKASTPLHREAWNSLGFPIDIVYSETPHKKPSGATPQWRHFLGEFVFQDEVGTITLYSKEDFVLYHELGHAAFQLARHHGFNSTYLYFEEFVLTLQTDLYLLVKEVTK